MIDDASVGRRPGRRSILAASLAFPFLAAATRKVPPAALIVPLTGARAALGRSMARAATLAQARDANGLIVLDGGDGQSAIAAREAIKRGAGLILGPLLAADVPAVLAVAAGRVPVVTFSNDGALREGGAFLLGITADQMVASLLRYARGRGIRRIALAPATDRWAEQVAAAARTGAGRAEIEIVSGRDADALLAAAPDAVVPAGTQLLLAPAVPDLDPALLRHLQGAWLAAPDPAGVQSFAAAFEAANGTPPGTIAGLAYDAATMARTLRQGGGLDRSALLAPAGFAGICGAFTFRDDGTAARPLAILAVDAAGYRVIDAPAIKAPVG